MKTALFKVDRNAQGDLVARVLGVVNYREQQDILISLTSLSEQNKSVRQPTPTTTRLDTEELELGVFVYCTIDDVQRVFDLVNLSLKTQDLRPAEAPKPVVKPDGTVTEISAAQLGEKLSIINTLTGEKLQLYIENSDVEIFKKNSDVTVISEDAVSENETLLSNRAFSLDDGSTLQHITDVSTLLSDYESGHQPIIFRFAAQTNSALTMEIIGLRLQQAHKAIAAYEEFQRKNLFDPLTKPDEADYDQEILRLRFSLKTDATYFLYKNIGTFFSATPAPQSTAIPCFKLKYTELEQREGALVVSTPDQSRLDPTWLVDRLRGIDAKLTQTDRTSSPLSSTTSQPNMARLEIHRGAVGVTGRIPLVRPLIYAIFRNDRIEISNDPSTYRALIRAGLIRPSNAPPKFGFSNGDDK